MNSNPKMSADALLEDALRAVNGSTEPENGGGSPRTPGSPLGAGLPSPKASQPMGLPIPKINQAAGLPSLKDGQPVGLPIPKINQAAGLPSPKDGQPVGLPIPKINQAAGLPSPKDGQPVGLPSPKNSQPAGLPIPKDGQPVGLPSPKNSQPAGLPIPKDGQGRGLSDLPAPKAQMQDNFPSIRPAAAADSLNALNQAVGQHIGRRGTVAIGAFSLDDDLEDDLASRRQPGAIQRGMENPDMAVPKIRLGNEPPAIHSEHVLAQGYEPAHDFDNDSGLPLNDDPLGLAGHYEVQQPAQPQGSFEDILGLFDDEAAGGAAAPKPAPAASPVPQPAAVPPSMPKPAAVPSVAQPPAAVPAGADVPVVGGAITEVSETEEEEAEGELFELNTIQKDGQGLARPMDGPSPGNAVQDESQKRKKKIMLIAAACVAAIAVLSVVGYVVLGILDKQAQEAMNATPVVYEEKVIVDWDIVELDRLFAYQMFNKKARERLAQQDVSDEERAELQGKLLLNGALALVRYHEVFKPLGPTLDAEATAASASGSKWGILGAWAWATMRGNEALSDQLSAKLPTGDAFDAYRETIEFATAFMAWNLEGQTFAQRMDAGKQLLKSFGKISSDLPVALWMHAETLNRLGRYEESIAILEKVKIEEEGEKFPAGVLYLLAQTYLKLDDIARASAAVDRLLKTADESEKVLYEKLRMTCDISMKPWSEMSDVIKTYIEAHKADQDDLMYAASLCRRVNRTSECRALFASVFDTDQRNIGLRKAYLNIYLANLGYRALIRPDGGLLRPQLESLLRVVEEGIIQAPDDIDFWKTKALVTYAQKDYEGSIRAVDEVERGKDVLWFGRFLSELMTYQSSDNVNKGATGQRLKKFANDVLEPDESIPLAQALAYVGELSASHQILERAMLIYPEETLILDDYYENALALKDIQLAANILERMRKRGALLSYHEYEYARLIEQLGDIDTALEKMVFLVDQTKNEPNYEFLAYVGELFLKQGKCDNALPYFSKALAVNPNDARTRYNKGQCLYKNKKFDAALIEFNEAATQDDTNHMYDLWIGQALAGLQQMSEAHRAFTAVIDSYMGIPVEKLSEQDVFILSEAHYFRAEIRKMQSRRSEARDDYLEALKFRSNERRYLTGYGIYLYENGNTKECIDTVTKIESLQAETMDSVLYFVRGLSRLKLNKPQEAVVDLEKARRAGYAELEESGIMGVREPAELYERLGYLYRDLGRKEEARQTLRLFLEKTTALSPSARREVQGELDKI